jgi:DUF971 family protein
MATKLTLQETTPREVMNKDGGLYLRWADGHETRYPFPTLRKLCHCASCAGEPDKPLGGAIRLPLAPPMGSVEPAAMELVGNYAVGINWKDGHRSILPFENLRGECRCQACRPA